MGDVADVPPYLRSKGDRNVAGDVDSVQLPRRLWALGRLVAADAVFARAGTVRISLRRAKQARE